MGLNANGVSVETADAQSNGVAPVVAALDWIEAPSSRRAEVEARQQLIGQWLYKNQFDALLLFDPENMAWFTAGGRFSSGSQSLGDAACLYVTIQHRCLIANNHHTARLFAEEIDGLGFYLKELSWTLPVSRMVNELCLERKVVADRLHPAVTVRRIELLHLRRGLSTYDAERFRSLARSLSEAVEATCRSIQPGMTELEIAGQLSHRLIRLDIEPISIFLYCDGRSDRFPRPIANDQPVHSHCTILATGRSRGLSATTSRIVAFAPPGEEVRSRHRSACVAAASILRYAKAGEAVARAFPLVKVSLQATGREFAWHDAPIGGFSGYYSQLDPFLPESTESFSGGDAISVLPLVEGCVSADTAIVGVDAAETLCFTADWPILSVKLGDVVVERPDILVRTT